MSHLFPLASQLVGAVEHGGQAQQEGEDIFPELLKDAGYAEAMGYFQSAGGFGALFQLELDSELSDFLARIMPLYMKNSAHAPQMQEYVKTHRLPLNALKATAATDGQYPVVSRLKTLTVPTLILNEKYDIFCPAAQARSMQKYIPGSKLMLFENSGHFPWVEEPDLFVSTLIDFMHAKS